MKKIQVSKEELARMEALAGDGCKDQTICTLMGWNRNLLTDRKDLREIVDVKRAERKHKLLNIQWEHAKKYAPMAMFLGKNELGQADKQTVENEGMKSLASALAMMVKNDRLKPGQPAEISEP